VFALNARDPVAALDELGSKYFGFRHTVTAPTSTRRLSQDFPTASTYEATGHAAQSNLAAFGLPLHFSFYHGAHAGAIVSVSDASASNDQGNPTDSRRASPIFLRVLKTAEGRYFGLGHFFKAKFVEEPQERLHFWMKKKAKALTGVHRVPSAPFPVDWTSVENFVDSLGGAEIHVA
jgi:hypothetical protein